MEHLPGAKPLLPTRFDKAWFSIVERAQKMDISGDTLAESTRLLESFKTGARLACVIFTDPEERTAELAGCDAGIAEGLAILAARHEAEKK